MKKLQKRYLTNYNLGMIDSAWFRTSSLSNLVDNCVEGTYETECKHRHDNRKFETCGINTKIVSAVLNTQKLKMI